MFKNELIKTVEALRAALEARNKLNEELLEENTNYKIKIRDYDNFIIELGKMIYKKAYNELGDL